MDQSTKKTGLHALWKTSHLAGSNAAYLEQLYESYLKDPDTVDPEWRTYFTTLPKVNGTATDVPHSIIREGFRRLSRQARDYYPSRAAAAADTKQVKVLQLINAYRFRGHQQAHFNPLEPETAPDIPDLHLSHHGLTESDLDTVFDTGSLVGPDKATLREILGILQQTYSSAIGAEYMYITNTAEKRWIQNRLETARGKPLYSAETKRRLLDRITAGEGLEHYLHTRYVGQKRFSLEGGESLIPLLDEMIQRGGAHGVKEVIIGMAHRGRLNVLVNIMGKTPAELFKEFEGKHANGLGSGDVKYHMGFSSNIETAGGPTHVALAFNPSHLEIVGPVVEGSVRARQDRRNDKNGTTVVPLVIHGDAAFAAQGVVMETFNMSQSRGYTTKGTVHIIINNQIGFTTSHHQDARSSFYCTDVAKMVDAPIFHVDGDDPEAVVFAGQLALDYRMTFRKDVVVDIVCYRRHGHSEADEPSVTQPLMYQTIRAKPTTRELYAKHLLEAGVIKDGEAEAFMGNYRDALDAGDSVAPGLLSGEKARYPYEVNWRTYISKVCPIDVDTRVSLDVIREVSGRLQQLPEGFALHANVLKIFDNRRKMAAGALPVDWGLAETLAYATLLNDGFKVRLSGQDSGRGTFFHRHAIVYNQKNGDAYVPLAHVNDGQADFCVFNSLLSEEAVLAFEYGYATTDPSILVIWEAQFGDFANNAQVVIDQFISAGEQKWNRLNGLVMLLPHGFEGQGPEHSSGRLERYLQLCAEHNMQVCVPTTAAQIFHLLRRQMLATCRKPLIVMTPKSLLRHRLATSTLEDLSEGTFKCVIPEIDELEDAEVKRVVLCSGKVYYDLLERRRELERVDIAILRMEQLYPFPEALLRNELKRYKNAEYYIWCQEEPKNQGAWYSSQHHVRSILGHQAYLEYVGRPLSASPAVGYPALHVKQQRQLVDEALGIITEQQQKG